MDASNPETGNMVHASPDTATNVTQPITPSLTPLLVKSSLYAHNTGAAPVRLQSTGGTRKMPNLGRARKSTNTDALPSATQPVLTSNRSIERIVALEPASTDAPSIQPRIIAEFIAPPSMAQNVRPEPTPARAETLPPLPQLPSTLNIPILSSINAAATASPLATTSHNAVAAAVGGVTGSASFVPTSSSASELAAALAASKPPSKRDRPSVSVASSGSTSMPRATRKRKKGDAAEGEVEDQDQNVEDEHADGDDDYKAAPPKAKKPRAATSKKKTKKKAAPADEPAEEAGDNGEGNDMLVDPHGEKPLEEDDLPLEKRTLLSILNDTRTGTPSRSAIERRKRKRLEAEAKKAAAVAATNGGTKEEKAPEAVPQPAPAPPKKSSGIQMKLVNGELVVAEESLVLSAADQSSSHLDQPFENNRTVTSASYTNRQKCEQWTQEETKLFFKSLAQYGTDFTFISQMFPKRTRRQIKNKFKREEKENQYLVDAALRKKIPIDEDEFHTRMSECNALNDAKRKKAEAEEAERLRKEEEAKKKLEEEERKEDESEEDEEEEAEEEDDADEDAEDATEEKDDAAVENPAAEARRTVADDDEVAPMEED